MALFALAGLDPATPIELARPLLVEHARLFLAGGGALSLADWRDLQPTERAAFVAAGRALAVEQAVRIGTAAQGDLGALRVQAEVDGGEAHDGAILAAAVRQHAEEARRAR